MHERDRFSSYKHLITPGFFAQKQSLSRSSGELRDEDVSHRDRGQESGGQGLSKSAFSTYRKPVKQASFAGSSGPFGGRGRGGGGRGEGEPPARRAQSVGSVLSTDTGDGEEGEEKHTVIATAKGFFTSKGGVLEAPDTGVSIYIPEGAINEGKEQEIYFKVCRDNSLLPPLDAEKGETLLSPLVMCGPHGTEFNKPVELRLPHCASANPESWSFALKSSDSPSGETTEWHNMTLAGSEGGARGTVDKSSVSILVDHF
ncbi:tight junction protein ZO-1 [Aplysia californica]|uniref:Tight junction protein ZO-1 n=1 Tax=Aplysia californica TaxID=6500 RepID=A0ABM1ADW7_APLCA|nr:tight junction protein ZO-1 [Aplysia californica]